VQLIKDGEQNDWLSITIHEGRNRQIRRMCEAVSLSVVRLKRVRYGTLEIGSLKPGLFRFLTGAEVSDLIAPRKKPVTARITKERREMKAAGEKRKPLSQNGPKGH
jgi:23S rRNA pseudouridine2605 synthase